LTGIKILAAGRFIGLFVLSTPESGVGDRLAKPRGFGGER